MPPAPFPSDRLDRARRLLWLALLGCLAPLALMVVDGLMRAGQTAAPLAAWVRPLGGPALALVPAGQPLRRFGRDPGALSEEFSPWLGGVDPDPARLMLHPADGRRDPLKAFDEAAAP